jgi:hypothetical protein
LINRNVHVITENPHLNQHIIRIIDPELTKLAFKYNGIVNIKISRPEEPSTDRQNRAMHSLLAAYYVTGLHSMPNGTLEDFKNYMKCQYGVTYEIEVKGQKYIVLKSWADYSKRQRREFIDGLISEVHQSGAYAESEKIREILAGMELKTEAKR